MAKKRPTLTINVGDTVLIGAPGVSMPGDWWPAKVLLVEGDEIATVHSASNGTVRQFLPITHVRAAGDYVELRAYQDRCREAIGNMHKAVGEAEQALGKAREAVWAKLDEIAVEVPGATR